ncbi:MAG: hypothetical protein N3I86_13650 [Verrucomicrobiae bacterium]|nr:hypothetical protein [Verrucomicrobiae bacterium]MDW8309239.1 hypothetical protein [Verrucomicrobiales bacterium]
MKPNPVLEELWRIKDELAREAGDDVHQLCENTRKWAAEHPHPGPVVRNADELRQLLAEIQRRPPAEPTLTLKDQPPHQP